MSTHPTPLWQPSTALQSQSQIAKFIAFLENKHQIKFPDYAALHHFSVSQACLFWEDAWEFLEIKGQKLAPVKTNPITKFLPYDWFPNTKLNYAQNLLSTPDDREAIISYTELGHQETITRKALSLKVKTLAQRLKNFGVNPGDRVAGYLNNTAQAHIAMLASTAIGAVWTSCSPDFGTESVVDRFSQVTPKILITIDGYHYKKKAFSLIERVAKICNQLESIETVILISELGENNDLGAQHHQALQQQLNKPELLSLWSDWLAECDLSSFAFEQFHFNHPLFILYSSGTTGKPKCIVHSTGGTLLQHLKELVLHTNVTKEDRFLYYTSCGWMMWNWAASALATGATLVLYDGAPLHPTPTQLLALVSQANITILGTSARYLHALNHSKVTQQQDKLKDITCILSTGSPLAAEDFEYVYQELTPQARLCSISGGTDIISCFVLGNPILPIHSGEIQCAGLGMAVEIWDQHQKPLHQSKGELVCTQPFPSMPLYFWNDPENQRYQSAYFKQFPNTWAHGDYAQTTQAGGFIIHGRSDTVLNPQGVRIGTAEIYNPLSRIEAIADCLVTALEKPDGDCQVTLFVVPQESALLSSKEKKHELTQTIKQTIRDYASPRHVPTHTAYVDDLPKTHSGKLMEVLVRELINGREPNNISAVSNPQCLETFRNWRPS